METAEHKALLSKGGNVDDKVSEILVQLGRLHTKIELLQQALTHKTEGFAELKVKVEALEKQQNRWVGAIAVGTPVLAFVVWMVQQMIGKAI